MKSSFKIGRIAGIEVNVHITLFLVLIIFSYALYYTPYPFGFAKLNYSQFSRILLSVISAISLFVAVLLHELSHSIVGRKRGVEVKGIVLFIFGGISMLENLPKEPRKEIEIAFAGPLLSIIIGLVFYLVSITNISFISEFSRVFATYNLFLAFFNLIPAFPLDGGRIVRGIIASRIGFVRATQIAAEMGKMIAIFLGILGLFTNPWLILIALFIYIGANEEEKMVMIESILKRVKIGEIMSPDPITISPKTPVRDVLNMMLKFKHLRYPVIENDQMVGIVTLKDIVNADQNAEVSEVMSKNVISVSPSTSAFEAFKIINEKGIGRLPVVENDRLVGIVSRTDLIRVLEILGAHGAVQEVIQEVQEVGRQTTISL
jgi:Zn-dependent protease